MQCALHSGLLVVDLCTWYLNLRYWYSSLLAGQVVGTSLVGSMESNVRTTVYLHHFLPTTTDKLCYIATSDLRGVHTRDARVNHKKKTSSLVWTYTKSTSHIRHSNGCHHSYWINEAITNEQKNRHFQASGCNGLDMGHSNRTGIAVLPDVLLKHVDGLRSKQSSYTTQQ